MDHDPDNHPIESFIKPFAASLVGGYLGHLLDQTRFGVWFNNNRTINQIFFVLGTVLRLVIVALVLYFCFLVVQQFSK